MPFSTRVRTGSGSLPRGREGSMLYNDRSRHEGGVNDRKQELKKRNAVERKGKEL
jgi:hypothetical protein